MKKKLLSLLVAGILVTGTLSGCGAAKEDTTDANSAATSENVEATDAKNTENKVIKVAASSTPHAEILAKAKDILAKQGYDLEVTEFEDYVQPNEVVESGEFDANYFQHIPYLDSFNKEKGTHKS